MPEKVSPALKARVLGLIASHHERDELTLSVFVKAAGDVDEGVRAAAVQGLGELGTEVLAGLYVAEIEYLRREEWAQTAQDILWRRTKLGLHVWHGSEAELDDWLAAHPRPQAQVLP